jgi:hypothetical protein
MGIGENRPLIENSGSQVPKAKRPYRRKTLAAPGPAMRKFIEYAEEHPGEIHELSEWGQLLGGVTKQAAGQTIDRVRKINSAYEVPLTSHEQRRAEKEAMAPQAAQARAERARQEEARLTERAQVRALILEGKSGPTVADMLGKEKPRIDKIRAILREKGQIPRVREQRRSKSEITRSDRRVKRLYDAGLSYALISARTGLDDVHVKAALTRLGKAKQIIRRASKEKA